LRLIQSTTASFCPYCQVWAFLATRTPGLNHTSLGARSTCHGKVSCLYLTASPLHSAPTYLNALVRANVTPRTLRSSSERRSALPSVQAWQSRLFSFVVPRSAEEHTSALQSHL